MQLVSTLWIPHNQRILEVAAQSVCDQWLADWQWIFANDAFIDASAQIVRDLAVHDSSDRYIDRTPEMRTG